MPSVLASKVISDFRRLIQDELAPYRYPEAEVIDYLNGALKLLTYHRPDSYTVRENLQLAPGALQAWPDADARVLQVLRNRGTSGNDNGRAVTFVDLTLLRAIDPNFTNAATNAEAWHYTMDGEDKGSFYVYPPQPNPAAMVEILRSAETPDITADTETVPVNDRFAVMLPFGMLFLAYSKDGAEENNAANADKYFQLFLTNIGVVDQ